MKFNSTILKIAESLPLGGKSTEKLLILAACIENINPAIIEKVIAERNITCDLGWETQETLILPVIRLTISK